MKLNAPEKTRKILFFFFNFSWGGDWASCKQKFDDDVSVSINFIYSYLFWGLVCFIYAISFLNILYSCDGFV